MDNIDETFYEIKGIMDLIKFATSCEKNQKPRIEK